MYKPIAVSEHTPLLIRMGRILLFIHLLFSPLLFQRGLIEVFEYPKTAWLTAAAILLLAGWVSHRAWHLAPNVEERNKKRKGMASRIGNNREKSRDLIVWGMGLFLASGFFSTLFSMNGIISFYGEHENFYGLITLAAYTVLFFGTRALVSDPPTLLMATVLAMACMVPYGIIQALGLDPFTWKRTAAFTDFTRIFGTLGHPNHFAAFLVMGFPLVAYFRNHYFKRRLLGRTILLILLEMAAAVLVVFAVSRGAWVAMGMMLIVFAVGQVIIGRPKQIFSSVPWMIGLLIGVLAFPFMVSINREKVTAVTGPIVSEVEALSEESASPLDLPGATPTASPDRLNPPSESQPSSLEPAMTLWARIRQMGISALVSGTRWPIWSAAFSMFWDHPIFGVGLDCFRLAFQLYRPVEYWHREWGGTPTHAHNELLHILATQGIFGGIAVFVLTAGLVRAFIRVLRRPEIPDRTLPVALFSGIVGFYVQNIFSFTVVGTGTLFVTLTAMMSQISRSPSGHSSLPPPSPPPLTSPPTDSTVKSAVQVAVWVIAGTFLYLLVFAPFYAHFLMARTLFNRSLPASKAVTLLEEAVALHDQRDLYFYHLGATYRRAAREDAAHRGTLLKLAQSAYQRAIDLVPQDSQNYIHLANLLLVMAKESPPLASAGEIYKTLEKAQDQDPHNADVYLISADIATALGNTRQASLWAEKAISLYPYFAPPYAQLGFIALIDASRLGNEGKHAEVARLAQEAIDKIEKALPLFWANHTEKKTAAKDHRVRGYLFLAKAHERLGEWDAAEAAYRHLLKIEPADKEAVLAFEEFQKRKPPMRN